MKKIYVRWLGWHSFVNRDTFKFELSRGTESCAEVLTGNFTSFLWNDNPNIWVGLLCEQTGVIREFKNDAWSELSGTQLRRGKNGVYSGNKLSCRRFTHTEAWVKPGMFRGIVLAYYFDALPKSKQELIRTVSRRYNLPVYYIEQGGLKRVKEVFK